MYNRVYLRLQQRTDMIISILFVLQNFQQVSKHFNKQFFNFFLLLFFILIRKFGNFKITIIYRIKITIVKLIPDLFYYIFHSVFIGIRPCRLHNGICILHSLMQMLPVMLPHIYGAICQLETSPLPIPQLLITL